MKSADKRPVLCALAAVSLTALAGCQGGEPAQEAESAEVADGSLASVLAGAEDLSLVEDTLADAGMAEMFDGTAPYTILAPRNEAFDGLGEDLTAEKQRPVMIAILRSHILPGYLTKDDIASAIEQDPDGTVEMTTMGDNVITFTMEDGAIVATSDSGAHAKLVDGELRAQNGVVIPLDAVLKEIAPAA